MDPLDISQGSMVEASPSSCWPYLVPIALRMKAHPLLLLYFIYTRSLGFVYYRQTTLAPLCMYYQSLTRRQPSAIDCITFYRVPSTSEGMRKSTGNIRIESFNPRPAITTSYKKQLGGGRAYPGNYIRQIINSAAWRADKTRPRSTQLHRTNDDCWQLHRRTCSVVLNSTRAVRLACRCLNDGLHQRLITTAIKLTIKLKNYCTSVARHLQPSLAFCCSYNKKLMRAANVVQQLCNNF